MGYRFYENWTADDKAVIHEEECGFCNFGQGCHDNPLGERNGRWSDSFGTLEEAEEAAEATGRQVRHHNCLDDD